MILCHFDKPVCKHCLIEQIFRTFNVISVLFLQIAWLTVGINANGQKLPFLCVNACLINGIFNQFKSFVYILKGIEVCTRLICFEGINSKLVRLYRLFYCCCNFEIEFSWINILLGFYIEDDVKTTEFDFRTQSFASIKNCKHHFWYLCGLQSHSLLLHIEVKRLNW